ncbi:uncharacterized protein BKCO1_3300050 [Diplodia corticola]|uniref:Uncharacterized protein n=1 Tax=Diplodia corticola TaxID=236234 RepID=A0A1J9QVY3_9PEZI|nr:uncharacterized protein BKCO1_3300050 [Diplodia corticola]OJD33150.1 hypothetical protein BKCO1_3300050 [Diplodia corticola]
MSPFTRSPTLASPTEELRTRSTNSAAAAAAAATTTPDSTPTALILQALRNPHDLLPFLLLLGGEVVQKALAQATGRGQLAPVCFSFGWASYAFVAAVQLLGDGRLMPAAEVPCKVYNMRSAYARANRNWVVGRLLRDNELFMARQRERLDVQAGRDRGGQLGRALRIAIYEPAGGGGGSGDRDRAPLKGAGAPPYARVSHLGVTAAQCAVAVVPWVRGGDWLPFVVTAVGTGLAAGMGLLPQWRAEKLPEERTNRKTFAVTAGNGSKDIMIIRNLGLSYDLEDLSTFESPRLSRAWQQCGLFRNDVGGEPFVRTFNGLPLDFWFTRIVCFSLAVGWLVLLLLVAGMKRNSWYLFVVAALGMMQNIYVAGCSVHPEMQLIPLILRDQILGNKVMDALMDLEVTLERDPLFGEVEREAIVEPLIKEYFPGRLRKDNGEIEWWAGHRDHYDRDRLNRKTSSGLSRGVPRSRWFVTDPDLEKDLVDTSSVELLQDENEGISHHASQTDVQEPSHIRVEETQQLHQRHRTSHGTMYNVGITSGMT